MAAHADAVLRGQQMADSTVLQLQAGIAPATALERALEAVLDADEPQQLRAFLTRLQGHLERSHG